MKVVRLQNNIVAEIIPEYALPVEKWYGVEFAAQCVEAPDDIKQGMVYDPETETFSEPIPPESEPAPEMTLEEAILDKLTELEYRQDLMELGLTEGGI